MSKYNNTNPVSVEKVITKLRKTYDTVAAIEANTTESGYTIFKVHSPEASLDTDITPYEGNPKLVVRQDDGSEIVRGFHAESDPYGLESHFWTLVYCDGELMNKDSISIEEGSDKLSERIIEEIQSDNE